MRKKETICCLLMLGVLCLCAACSDQGSATQTASTDPAAESSAKKSTGESVAESTQASAENSIADSSVTTREDLTFPIGQAMGGGFTGTVYFTPMIQNESVYNFPQTNHITFEPGARSAWHAHGGMIILVTGGVGFYQEEGKPAQILRQGDVMECPEGVRHWHGAAPDSWFSQMVIYDSHYTSADGEESVVTDEEYQNLDAVEYEGRVQNDSGLMFPKAENTMDSPTFSGSAYVSSLIGANNVAGAPDFHYVVFDPGVINNWHTHEGGQILIATDGIGYHQIEGQEVEVLHPGDVAYCPPGVKHWHGGSADAEFAHIAVNTNSERPGVEWFDRISDEEYAVLRADGS